MTAKVLLETELLADVQRLQAWYEQANDEPRSTRAALTRALGGDTA